MASIQRDTRDGVVGYLEKAGFTITERIDSAYANAVMIVQARKPEPIAIRNVPEARCRRDEVFISYSHEDRDWLKHLQVFLTPAFRAGRLKLWADSNLRTGDTWRAEIEAAISRARVAVLLVSPHFLASDFIEKDEFPKILEAASREGLTIVWMLVSAAPYEVASVGRIIQEIQCAHPVDKPLDTLREPERNQVFTTFVRDLMRFFPDEGGMRNS